MERNSLERNVSAPKSQESLQSAPESAMTPPAFQLKVSSEASSSPAQLKGESGGGGNLPGDLVGGFAQTTGHDLSDVRVHHNSSAPSQVGALAYAQGNDIHLGAGQEQHLAHEAAHIVQQREGRVQANTQVNGMPVNDNKGLESEADSMGAKAAQMKTSDTAGAKQLKTGNGSAQMKAAQLKEGDAEDPLKVDAGQITFDAEGNDVANSAYFSRQVHWPGGVSGVTIGRGYDLGQRGKAAVEAHLKAAGITGSQASLLAAATGLTGKAAGEWVTKNKKAVGTITHEQQKLLFDVVYDEHKADVVRLSGKKDVKEKYGAVDFEKLHPAITDMLVDLRYRGDYHSRSRAWIQPLAVKNDLKGFAAAMADEKWKTDYGVPKDRFNRRRDFMAAAVKGGTKPNLNAPDTTKPQTQNTTTTATSGEASATAIDAGVVKASSLNVRSGPNASAAKVGEPLKSGATVKVYEKANGWLRIGANQWVSGEYVELTGNKGGTTAKPETKPTNQVIANGTVSASTLNVRSGPGTTFEKVGDPLKSGAKVQIYEERDGWARIGPGRWVSSQFISKNTGKPANTQQSGGTGGGNASASKPAWISTAEAEVGQTEIVGNKHNPRIIEYHSTTGKFKDDETPWCASFVNWVMKNSGGSGTGSASAMSFKSWGKKLDKPAYGAIAVFSYGGGKGHVGFVVGKQGSKLLILGGNQGNSVKVSSFGTSQIAAYVVPSDYEVPSAAYNLGGMKDEVEDGGGVANTR